MGGGGNNTQQINPSHLSPTNPNPINPTFIFSSSTPLYHTIPNISHDPVLIASVFNQLRHDLAFTDVLKFNVAIQSNPTLTPILNLNLLSDGQNQNPITSISSGTKPKRQWKREARYVRVNNNSSCVRGDDRAKKRQFQLVDEDEGEEGGGKRGHVEKGSGMDRETDSDLIVNETTKAADEQLRRAQ